MASSFRLTPRDTSFETPASFDTGAWDYYKTVAYDALYHSPVGLYGVGDAPTGGVGRFSELFLEKNYGTNKISADEATAKYGLGGLLRFDEEIYESAAQLMKDRKLAENRRDYLIQSGSTSFIRSAVGFPVGMASSLLDPTNLASMFVPIVGQSKFMSGTSATGLARGLITPRQLARTIGTGRTRTRLARGAVEGLVGQAAVEPFVLFPNIYEQSNYGFEESVTNVGAGAILGAGLHFSIGQITDKFALMGKALSRDLDTGTLGRSDLGGPDTGVWNGIDLDTHAEAVQGALADLLQDNPVTSPAEALELSRASIFEELRQDIIDRQGADDVVAHRIRQSREGYNQLVNQYKDKGSRLPWDPELATKQALKQVENTRQISFKPLQFANHLLKDLPKLISDFEKNIFDKFFEKSEWGDVAGNDPEFSVFSQIFDGAEFGKGPGYANFESLFKEALKMGYDLPNAKLGVGVESLAYMTKNRVVKFSLTKNTDTEVKGLTTISSQTIENGPIKMTVSEKLMDLDTFYTSKNKPESLEDIFDVEDFPAVFDAVGQTLGYRFPDADYNNIGVNARGEILLFDTGRIQKLTVPFRTVSPNAAEEINWSYRRLTSKELKESFVGYTVVESRFSTLFNLPDKIDSDIIVYQNKRSALKELKKRKTGYVVEIKIPKDQFKHLESANRSSFPFNDVPETAKLGAKYLQKKVDADNDEIMDNFQKYGNDENVGIDFDDIDFATMTKSTIDFYIKDASPAETKSLKILKRFMEKHEIEVLGAKQETFGFNDSIHKNGRALLRGEAALKTEDVKGVDSFTTDNPYHNPDSNLADFEDADLALYDILKNQVESHVPPKVSKAELKKAYKQTVKKRQQIKKRLYQQKRKRLQDFKREQKILDKDGSILENDVKTIPDPVEPTTSKVIKENTAEIREQAFETEELLKTPKPLETKAKAKTKPEAEAKEDPYEEFGDLSPAERKLLMDSDESIARLASVKNAIKEGFKCIVNKVI